MTSRFSPNGSTTDQLTLDVTAKTYRYLDEEATEVEWRCVALLSRAGLPWACVAALERVQRRATSTARLYRRGQGAARRPHRCAAPVEPAPTFVTSPAIAPLAVQPDAPQRRVSNDPNAVDGPDPNRPREFLEQFPLDTCAWSARSPIERASFGLVQTTDGLVHRVDVGNHMARTTAAVVSHYGFRDSIGGDHLRRSRRVLGTTRCDLA
jgi:Tfp pilus assembly protein PilP